MEILIQLLGGTIIWSAIMAILLTMLDKLIDIRINNLKKEYKIK